MKKVYVFSATWCGPCQAYKPIVNEAIPEIEARGYEVSIIDVDKDVTEANLTSRYNIRGVPTTVIVHEDDTNTVLVGKQSKETLLNSLPAVTIPLL